MKFFLSVLITISLISNVLAQNVLPADTKFESYIPLIQNKKVGIFTNNAAQINKQNIIDVLIAKKINIVKIFTPEHGLTVNADAGDKVNDSTYHGISVISLYGKKTSPSKDDLNNIDTIIYDVQDVGVRYYTYISSLQYLIEAALEYNKTLIILDRPNPNANYIDGPILDKKYKSFVGLQPIPIVYGMTIGEYANMLIGEHWLNKPYHNTQNIKIITLDNYTHSTIYAPNPRPSPNLPNLTAIYLYPSLGWFEGTKLSIGRGTNMPFQVLGAPEYKSISKFNFTPLPITGALNPPHKNQICYGWDLSELNESNITPPSQINLSLLINAYQQYPDKDKFFNSFFDKLAGSNQLRLQIIAGATESQIRQSWESGIANFKTIRQKYLLYP